MSELALITGGGGGIGAAIAARLAADGYRIAVADAKPDAAAAVAETITGATALSFDVTDAAAVATALARCDGLAVLVHAAGIGVEATFLDTTPEQFRHVLEVNLTGTFLCCQAAARAMAASGGGRIVTVASTAGELGSMRRAAYAASKAAVINLTKTIAAELAPLNVRANALSPGPVNTALVQAMHSAATRKAFNARVPLARYAEPHEIAAAAAFLASAEASYLTGHVLTVDGGFTAVPTVIRD